MYGWIIGLIIVGIVIIALVRRSVFQRNTRAKSIGKTNSSAMETLRNRYAKGEISKDEFEEKRAELEKTELKE